MPTPCRGHGTLPVSLRVVAILPAGYNPRESASSSDTERNQGVTATSFNLRVGIGEDSHRTAPGGPLRLGGIDLPHDRQLVGHSDADVLLHAVTDALLGAAALPDIGRMFPDTDEANRGRDSAEMLFAAAAKVAEANYRVVNLDCVVHAQRPKLADYQDAIRHRIAGILRISPHQIGLKAKTGEGIGPVGNEEVIEARCIALLKSTSDA
jgi:2-C-methyl-D-erythritol 2,4-cyclodiphosphate synthase